MSVNPIKGKFVRLQNDEPLKSRNQADSADVEILKVNASDKIEVISLPVFNDGIDVSQLSTEKYVDGEIATVEGRIDDHVNGVAEKHGADDIVVVPSGNLSSTDVQAALSELQGDIDTNAGAISSHLSDTVDAHDASAISVVPTGNLGSTDAQAALQELQGDIDTINTTIGGLSFQASAISVTPAGNLSSTNVQSALEELQGDIDTNAGAISSHLSDTVDAHDASAISVVPAGNLSSTDVQAALSELQGDIDTNAGDLSSHLSDTVDAHDASAISFVPAGNLSSTEVQAALEELDSEKVAKSGDTMSGNLIMGNNSITNLLMTLDPHSAATRQYVDNVAEGLHVHAPVRALRSTAVIGTYDNGVDGVGATITPTSAVSNIDGIGSFAIGQRIILNGQSNSWENGVYTVSAIDGSNHITEFTRASDFDTPTEVAGGDFIFVQSGSTYANTGWVETKTTTALGFGVSDPIEFLQFSGAGSYTPGDGLDLTGTVFSVNVSELLGDGIQDDGSNNFAVKVSDFAGDGLEDDGSNNLKIKINNGLNSGLSLSGAGLELRSDIDGNGLNFSAGQLYIDLLPAGGLSFSGSALTIDSSIAGAGLDYSGGVVSVNAGQGIEISGDDVQVKLTPTFDSGLEFDTNGYLRVASYIAGAGLGFSSGIASVNVDDSTIEINLDSLRIKDDGVTASKINSDVAGDGLVQALDGSLAVNAGDGIQLLSDAVAAKVSDFAGAGLEDDGSNNLRIASSAAGDGLSLSSGIFAVNAGDGIQLLSDAVAAKVSDLAGNGLEDDGSNNLRIKKQFSTISDISVSSSGLSIANRWNKEAYTIVAADSVLTSNYYDLDFEIESNSLVAFVDRLAIHEGASFDYTLSVVGGVTRVTFLNVLVTAGQQKLAAGDQLFFTYQKKAA